MFKILLYIRNISNDIIKLFKPHPNNNIQLVQWKFLLPLRKRDNIRPIVIQSVHK